MNESKSDEDISTSSDSKFIIQLLPGVVIGSLAFFINVFILAVHLCNENLKNSSAFMIALTAVHSINGAVHAIASAWFYYYDGTIVPVMYCVSSVWPEILLAVYQLLPILLALNAVERLLCLTVPIWYHKNCIHNRQWLFVAGTGIAGVALTFVHGIKGWFNDGPPILGNCLSPQVFGSDYVTLGANSLAIVGGLLATICTSVALHCARKKIATMPTNSPNELGRVKRQLRLTQCLLMICVIDVICVVGPNILLVLFNIGVLRINHRHLIFIIAVYASDSIWNISAFLMFNSEFRKTVSKLTPFKKIAGNSQLFTKASPQKGSNGPRNGVAGGRAVGHIGLNH